MIVITTPTGAIGSQVVNLLLNHDSAQEELLRVIVRNPNKLAPSVRDRVEVITGSHGDSETVARAFAGADAVFWLVPPDAQAPSLDAAYSGFSRAAVNAFAAQGISHVVGVSALGRGTPVADRAGLVTASLAMDDLIASTGVSYRALANASFMDNVLRQVASIRDDGVLTDTVDPRRMAPVVATRDIAATGVELLRNRSWTGVAEVPVLGPEDLSQIDMVRIMSEVLGSPVRYQQQSLEVYGATLASYGLGTAFVEGMVDMMRAKDDGLDAGAHRDSAGVRATTFRTWCTEVLRPALRL
jgi:uncharacterized protein YbjT (DUF2867 family)